MNCWEQQKLVLSDMLKASESEASKWKILIYDKRGMSIVGRIFHQQSLEDLQVTLFLRITDSRSHVSDAPAVYFVEPTRENIDFIVNDAEAGIYEFFYLNFTSSISRSNLDYFAQRVAEKELSHRFEKVFDQYTDFISLEHSLYTFDKPNFFFNVKASTRYTSDSEKKLLLDSTVDSLFSLCVTMEALPVICYSRQSDACKYVAEDLKDKLRAGRQSLIPFSPRHPLLLIFDREQDISSALRHSATYQALVHDVIGIKNNKLSRSDGKIVMLDWADEFWMETKGLMFPDAEQEYRDMIESYAAVRKEMTSGSADMSEMPGMIGKIGDINRQKDIIDKHNDILKDHVGPALQQRDLPDFYRIEDDLLLGENVKMEELLGVLEKGTPEDKLRFLIVHYLCKGDGEEHAELLDAASRYDISFEALNWVKTQRELHNRRTRQNVQESDPNLVDATKKYFGGLKKLLKRDETSKCEVTKILERLMATNTDEEFVYESVQGSNQLPPNFTEAIVFVWGGGSFVEFQNLQDSKASGSTQIDSIVYGSTHMPKPSEFLEELTNLGRN